MQTPSGTPTRSSILATRIDAPSGPYPAAKCSGVRPHPPDQGCGGVQRPSNNHPVLGTPYLSRDLACLGHCGVPEVVVHA